MNIVRIMPRQPIEAERINRPPAFRSLGREVLHHDGHETFLSARYWHEVSDPIVWDGSDAAHGAIEALLRPLGVTILLDDIDADELDEPMPALQLRNISSAFPTVGFITPMGSIRAEGDSFAILPPEVQS